ncbi:MAG: NAD(P)H-hydrate dehydratase [Bacteroidales bacterium]|nr:NAD(P)H-hydrate dehydratase [Bacteroidales bacterium]
MKLFTSAQIKEIDAYTIKNEPIDSVDLMERAATELSNYMMAITKPEQKIIVVCGVGNNGGDGLALTRILLDHGYNVKAVLARFSNSFSKNTGININRLKQKYPKAYSEIVSSSNLNLFDGNNIIVDAIFGSGLTRPVKGFIAEIIEYINSLEVLRIAVDVPSGLLGEDNTGNNGAIFKAHYTLGLQFPSISFFFPENQDYVGEFFVLPIGLHPEAIKHTETNYYLIDDENTKQILQHRKKYAHKGNFGHALLIAGSYGKFGAAVLSARACLRAGVGLLTSHIPVRAYTILQAAVPESMISIDESDYIFTNSSIDEKYNAIGVGPGLGCKQNTYKGLKNLIENAKCPLVFDADALNIIAANPDLLDILPQNSILTPHIGEFERLFGKTANSYQRVKLQKKWSEKLKIIIVCKGAHTSVSLPQGNIFFNTTGNPGMATAGSGDVLTGIILSLLAQNYFPQNAALLGVYLHGLAGDIALTNQSEESLIANDIIEHLGNAFKRLKE